MASKRARGRLRFVAAGAIALGCARSAPAPVPPPAAAAPNAAVAAPPTAEQAKAFIDEVNEDLRELWVDQDRTAWVKATYITHDTEVLSTQAQERVMEYLTRKIKEARRFEGVPNLSPDIERQLYILRYSAGLPAPSDPKERAELADISTKLESIYSKGEYCSPKLKGKGKDKSSDCLPLGDLGNILAESRDWDLLLDVWKGWHRISTPMRPMYERFVELGNKGARELGFSDMGEIWKGRYDMSQEAFVQEMDRLWVQVRPLYEALHCFMRARLRKQYGEDKIGKKSPIPAHVLGNMWAQEWSNLYPLVEPYKGVGSADLTKRLVLKKYDALSMVKLGEKFFTSLGMEPLPKTFWERSLFLKPRDRDVECHASAWDVDRATDLRIKMCIEIKEEDLVTIHHELGHDYYFLYYSPLVPLFQDGANDGFHEGIGDTLALSVTPSYLEKIGLFDKAPQSDKADLNLLMKRALDGIAFLPFGKLIDEWRWDVFSGKIKPSEYNAAWWERRKKYQGVAPPVDRTEQDFDPGAKYHIPANVPYTRYFIARILQYQFHRALCRAIGHKGPLHRCSIYGDPKAGQKMISMLKLGQSRPWPDALEAISGERQMDATAIIDYYAPLMEWLAKENKGQECGW
jgi:peptidyl-dipeptidase A